MKQSSGLIRINPWQPKGNGSLRW